MAKPIEARRALGKGLSTLLPARAQAPEFLKIPINDIEPNPMQPRSIFQPDRLMELADSIKQSGVLQPLVVQKSGEKFQLIAGERRWRAAKLAGLEAVPAIVRDTAPNELLELALVENIQREDLNPIETAQALDRLGRELSLSHEEIGRRTGKDRTTITNLLRLLKLPDSLQLLVAEHRLAMGHARAILGVIEPDLQKQLAERAVAEGMSVRQVERLVQQMNRPRVPEPPEDSSEEAAQDPNLRAAVRELEDALGTRVRITEKTSQRGRIELEYYSQDDLHRIYKLIVEGTK